MSKTNKKEPDRDSSHWDFDNYLNATKELHWQNIKEGLIMLFLLFFALLGLCFCQCKIEENNKKLCNIILEHKNSFCKYDVNRCALLKQEQKK